MKRTVLYMGMSLDGCVAGENDDLSWLAPYEDVDYGFAAFFSGIGAIIQGRRTYEIEVRQGWDQAHPVPTFVLSRHPPAQLPRRADVVFTSEDIGAVLAQAKQLSAKDVWIEGGASVARQYLQRRLIDDLVLTVVPVILGQGIPLFEATSASEPVPLTLRGVERFDKGLVQLHYTLNPSS